MLWIKGVIKIGFDIIFFKKVLEVASSSSPNLKLSWILCWHVLGYLCWYLRNIGDIRDMSPNLALEISNSVGIWSRVSISVGIWTRVDIAVTKYRNIGTRRSGASSGKHRKHIKGQMLKYVMKQRGHGMVFTWVSLQNQFTAFMWMIINFPDIDRKYWEASNVHFWSPWVWPLCNF